MKKSSPPKKKKKPKKPSPSRPNPGDIGSIGFRSLADRLHDVIMVFDRGHRHLYVNAYVETQTGIPVRDYIGKTHEELGFPEHLCKIWKEAIDRVFATNEACRIEFELPGGIWIDWFLLPEPDESGAVCHVITAARDITDRKRMEEELERRVLERTKELKQSEEKYRSLFEESKDMVYISTPEGRFLDINSAGIHLLGYTIKEEIQSLNVRDTYLKPESRELFQQEIHRNGFVKDFEVTLKRKDGSNLQAIITANAVRNKEGEISFYRGIIRDVTESRRLEQQLFQIQKMESIGELAGGIAHDFNNILSGIMGYASLMKTRIQPDHPFFNYIDTIERATLRAGDLITKLLTFAMGGSFHSTPVNLNEIILETIKIVSRAFDRSVEITTKLDSRLPTVEADPALIQQVAMNLLVNARDAMPNGGQIIVQTRIETIAGDRLQVNLEAREGTFSVISVSDTGVGIPAEHLGRIFEPFFSTKEKGKGTGLGLAVVYGAVKNVGGFVTVDSLPGRGSSFSIFLPVSGKPEASTRLTEAAPTTKGGEGILVVDDEQDILMLARDIFEEYGYRIFLAANGEEACSIFREHRDEVQLILLDIIMPKMGGLEAFEQIIAIDPKVRVILSTGYSKSERAQEIIDSGGAAFIQKPYQVQQLLTLVRKILDQQSH